MLDLNSDRAKEVALKARFTPKEEAVFSRLLASANETVPRSELLRLFTGAPRTLDTYMKNIRRKLGGAGFREIRIKTVTGVGYSCEVEL